MSLYRGAGGASDATDDSTVNAVAGYASSAASSATAAAGSATTATNNATAAATSASNAATSASNAATSASNASTSATNALASASNASSSASSASSSATTAANNAGVASNYAAEALGYRNTASTYATNAASSASAAAGSATSAANSAAAALAIYGDTATMEAAVADAQEAALTAQQESQAASDSALNAADSEDLALEHEQNAAEWATVAQNAANSATAASTSANAAWDQFDDRYLGAKTSDPTVDNDGNALITGALYFNNATSSMKVYTGSAWTDAYATGNGFLIANNNLSDLQSATTARTNLGLGSAALENSSALVHTTGDQTIGGTKTFSSTITGSISGNAGTVTNGVYTTVSYADPSWITSIAGSKVSGNISGNAATATSATSATTATNVSGGTASVTTLTTSSTVTLNGGTANGVAYLNGSKVLTTGSALTFDGTNLATNGSFSTGDAQSISLNASSSGQTNRLQWKYGGTAYAWIERVNSTGDMAFGVQSSEAMRLTSTGLGIGTSSPGAKLDVNGNAVLSGVSGYKYLYFNGATENSSLRFAKIGKNYDSTFELGIWASTHSSGNSAATVFYRDLTTESMRLDSSGNLGIGTSSPGAKLAVIGTSGTLSNACIRVNSTPGTQSASSGLWLSGNQSTSHYNWLLASQYNVNATFEITPSTAVDGATFSNPVYTVSNAGLHKWFNGTTQAMTLDASGNLLVGQTSTSKTNNGVQIYSASGNNGRIDLSKTTSGLYSALANYHSGTYVGGVDYSNSATSFPTSSDVRLKKDIVDAPSASAKIDQIRIVSHGWKHDDAVVDFGVIAQELFAIVPQAVTPGDDGDVVEKTWGVDYSKLVPLLVKAHQEQQAIIDAQQAALNQLNVRLDAANL